MNTNEKKQAERLYERLRETAPVSNETGEVEAQARLAETLRRTMLSARPRPSYPQELEKTLVSMAAQRQSPHSRLTPLLRSVLLAGLAVGLLSGLAWSIRSLLPHSPASAPAPEVTSTPEKRSAAEEAPAATSPLPTEEPVLPTPTPQTYHLAMLPGISILLATEIPESPTQAIVYEQLNEEALTIENAKAMARQLGVQGEIYLSASESPQQRVYTVRDGQQWINFMNSPYRFYFSNAGANAHDSFQTELTQEAQIAIAQQFLEQAGLLDFSYQIEMNPERPLDVLFMPTIDQAPVLLGNLNHPYVIVSVAPDGTVSGVDYNRIQRQSLGSFPIRSAQAAWDELLTRAAELGVEQADGFPAQTGKDPLEWWNRLPTQGEPTTIYGYLVIYQPAESGVEPLYTLGDYTLGGSLSGMAEVNRPGAFYQVMGTLRENQRFEVEAWQLSPFQDENLVGQVKKEDGKAYLITENEQLLLPDLPDGVAEAVEVRVRGIRLDQPEASFQWTYLETGGAFHGGGGGGGGTSFAALALDGSGGIAQGASATPMPGLPNGTLIEAARGTLSVEIIRYPDASEEKIVSLYLGEQNMYPGIVQLRLEGAGLEGIDAYATFPVRVWGNVTGQLPTGDVRVDVNRYEPVYPGLEIEAWLGTWSETTLEDTQVILFTGDQGQQFVLKSSIEWDPDSFVGAPGDRAILEGVLYPGETFAGYPVVEERSAALAAGITDLTDYTLTSTQVWVNDQPVQASGSVILEKIELAYRANDLRFGPYDPSNGPLYIQPVWRFYGHYTDGREFEIQVQALRDEYLK